MSTRPDQEWRLTAMREIIAMSHELKQLHSSLKIPTDLQIKMQDETLGIWGKHSDDTIIYCAICKTPDSYDFIIRHKFENYHGPCPSQTEAMRLYTEALNYLLKK